MPARTCRSRSTALEVSWVRCRFSTRSRARRAPRRSRRPRCACCGATGSTRSSTSTPRCCWSSSKTSASGCARWTKSWSRPIQPLRPSGPPPHRWGGQLLLRRFGPHLYLLAGFLEPLDADPEVALRVFRRLDGAVERELVRLPSFQGLLELVQRLLVGELCAQGLTSSMRPASFPDPSWIVTRCSTAASDADRRIVPLDASRVML